MSESEAINQRVEQAAAAVAERYVQAFWTQYEKRMQQGLMARQLQVPKEYQLTPYQVDKQRPGYLNLPHHKLLNFNPSAYFGCPIPWSAPADFVAAEFMRQFGFARLAPYSERIRLTTDGKVYVKAASGVWCEIFGLVYDWRNLQNPLRVINKPRLSEVKSPQHEQFLEAIG